MEFRDVVRKRRMWRNFQERPVPPEAVERILQNALHAPSAGFSQGWAFLALTEPDDRALFWRTEWGVADEEPGEMATDMMRAPVVIVPMSNKQMYLDRYAEPDKGWFDRDEARWPVPYWHIDAGFASMLMLLTAVDEGLGAVFFGMWRAPEFRAAFGVPDDFTPIGAIAIGYPAGDIRSPSLKRGRRGVDEAVHRGRW
jgi:nitroreductase